MTKRHIPRHTATLHSHPTKDQRSLWHCTVLVADLCLAGAALRQSGQSKPQSEPSPCKGAGALQRHRLSLLLRRLLRCRVPPELTVEVSKRIAAAVAAVAAAATAAAAVPLTTAKLEAPCSLGGGGGGGGAEGAGQPGHAAEVAAADGEPCPELGPGCARAVPSKQARSR